MSLAGSPSLLAASRFRPHFGDDLQAEANNIPGAPHGGAFDAINEINNHYR